MHPVQSAIEVRDFYYSYQGFTAVQKVNFTVKQGEFYALLGTNGAGKTTTLETIEGHRKPSQGSVRVLGTDPTQRQAIRSRMGIMYQESGFAPDLTVKETLNLMGKLCRRTDSISRLLSIVDLVDKHKAKVSSLSGGEKRRLDFAAAIFGTPDVLFLDEPTTGLDPQARQALWDSVGELRDHGVTILLTTHYLEEAERYADRIGLLHQGVLQYEGTLPELTAAYPSHIRFRYQPTMGSIPLSARIVDNTVVIESNEIQRDLHHLLNWAADHHHCLTDLSATTSGLADVFHTLSNSAPSSPK